MDKSSPWLPWLILAVFLCANFYIGLDLFGRSGKIVASEKRHCYHNPNCPWALKISDENFSIFPSMAAAESAGFYPCRVCRPKPQEVKVLEVIDGDTLHVEFRGRAMKIQLLYIKADGAGNRREEDTAFGRECAGWLRSAVKQGRLEIEFEEEFYEDEYRRKLVYLWVKGDEKSGTRDQCLNWELVRRGYSEYFRSQKSWSSPSYHKEFLAAQNEAKSAKAGIWSRPAP